MRSTGENCDFLGEHSGACEDFVCLAHDAATLGNRLPDVSEAISAFHVSREGFREDVLKAKPVRSCEKSSWFSTDAESYPRVPECYLEIWGVQSVLLFVQVWSRNASNVLTRNYPSSPVIKIVRKGKNLEQVRRRMCDTSNTQTVKHNAHAWWSVCS